MKKVHEFISKHIRILKWIPWVNWYLLLYYMIRLVFIKREMPKFSWAIKAIGITVGSAVLVAVVAYLLSLVLTETPSGQILDILMRLMRDFVFVPTFIGMCVKTDEQQ